VRLAKSDGPQHVTAHGRDAVVVLSAEEFRRLQGDRRGQTLVDVLQSSPHRDLNIESKRGPMPVRGASVRLCAPEQKLRQGAPFRSLSRMNRLYDIELKTIDGASEKLGAYAGKVMLVVNVASQCGFTPQYEGLEALYRRYRDRGLVVLGFPCDQFGHQEPGGEAQIKSFCTAQYDVTFPLFAKVAVNGEAAHPLYRVLKSEARGLLGTQAIKWNFTKFLIDKQGKVVKRYAPREKPADLAGDIEPLLS
jgi:glutathione peroxidase